MSAWRCIWRAAANALWRPRRLRMRLARQPRCGCGNWRRKRALHRASTTAAREMEAFERVLTVLEEKLFAALTAAAPEDLLVALKEHAARELAPYRSRMGAVQLRQVEHQFVQKQLLVHYNLPRLSLFYMSQQ